MNSSIFDEEIVVEIIKQEVRKQIREVRKDILASLKEDKPKEEASNNGARWREFEQDRFLERLNRLILDHQNSFGRSRVAMLARLRHALNGDFGDKYKYPGGMS